jgi:hypothetical protein
LPCACTAVPLQGDAEDRAKLQRQAADKAAAAAREEKQDLVMTEAGDMARLVRGPLASCCCNWRVCMPL